MTSPHDKLWRTMLSCSLSTSERVGDCCGSHVKRVFTNSVTFNEAQGEVLSGIKDNTSHDTLWVAFGVRSVVARVTTLWMDVVKNTMSAAVKLEKMLVELDIGQPAADCMPVDGVAFRKEAGYTWR